MTTATATLLTTESGKNRNTENFPVGSFLIRPDLRNHVHVFYNFARAADDISDHPLLEAAEKVKRLSRYEELLLDANCNDIPVVSAMRESLHTTGVTPQHCLDLLTAFKRDALQLRYRDWADLMDYCRYSASPVGRHVLALHGVGETAWPSNDALCSALQVINHIQDCADDYRELDRVYLPSDMLLASGAVISELSAPRSSPALKMTLKAMLDRLETLMPEAHKLPIYIPDFRLKCETSVIAELADRLIALLRQRDPLYDNVKLGKMTVLSALIKGLWRVWL